VPHTSLVLTVIGADRPGLVEALSEAVAAHGGSWLESRMAHLAGHFAGLLRVAVPEDRREALEADLGRLEARGLRVMIAPARAATATPPAAPLRLDAVGQDRPGIVREIARALSAQGVNVEELETHTDSAPMSGELLFHVSARLRPPAGVGAEALRGALEKIADELMVDLKLDEAGEGPGSA